ncbi:MAG: methyltransferase domain-containing protein [Alphaproteobacteria bacterium]|nr:methyltransferase domain-containing protein [Alphaproteobacteria bacterium]
MTDTQETNTSSLEDDSISLSPRKRVLAFDSPSEEMHSAMVTSEATASDTAHRLHIGGKQAKEGWRILNIQQGEGVDFIGDVADLSQFEDLGFDEVYASHVMEHLGYREELPAAFQGIHRILKPGGVFRMSVPDLEILCGLFVRDDVDMKLRFYLMRMMFGGQRDPHDFHKVGLTWDFARTYLGQAGFTTAKRVPEFGIFDDASSLRIGGMLISLNIEAVK